MTSEKSFIRDESGSDALIPADSATIYPLIGDTGNRRILREWLTEHDDYRVADTDKEVTQLCTLASAVE